MSRPTEISPKMFVRIWQAAPSAKAAAEVLGMKREAARSRARLYRSRGITLQRFSSAGSDHLDTRASGRSPGDWLRCARAARQGAVDEP